MLGLKPKSKPITEYYATLAAYDRHGVHHEMAVRTAFQNLLEHSCKKVKWTLIPEYKYKRPKRNPASVDGGMVDIYSLPRAYWEAKDSDDNLIREVKKKFDDGYPQDNIIFQEPNKAIIYQDGTKLLEEDITRPEALIDALELLFSYNPKPQHDWELAVEEFKPKIPGAAKGLVELIEEERRENKKFVKAFDSFASLCRASINPTLSDFAVEEMLVQHLLTVRIFRKVFHNAEFTNRNVIAHEIEKVITALTSRKFSREEFFKPLDRFYGALERRAEGLDDYDQKQSFLNTVYENFFQGFAVKVADTHGIVYTPQSIVSFMVKSVEEILDKEFGKSLSDKGVHILDPFVGTGNFITRVMEEIKLTSLAHKYKHELHCNEVLLLPYYVAAMNIEHAYYDKTEEYEPFDGICLVDTFELAEDKQVQMFTEENTERVNKLKQTPLFVILGNPPYNAKQLNENDNNKNRKYPVIDGRVADTFAKDSKATNKNALSDPYVKAIRWASDKIGENGEGVVAFVTNSGFVDGFAFDGMRKHLEEDFTSIYIFNMKGNARTSGELRRQEGGNIFDDQIRVGVSVNIFIKKKGKKKKTDIKIFSVDDYARSSAKKRALDEAGSYSGVKWKKLKPDSKNNWLTEGLQSDYEDLLPLGTKKTKVGDGNAIFRLFSNGVKTNRDAWAYNFNNRMLTKNARGMIEFYNEHVFKLQAQNDVKLDVDGFVSNDDKKISWSRDLKLDLKRNKLAEYSDSKIRNSIYRPFTKEFLFFDRIMNEEVYVFPRIFPTPETENRVICASGIGMNKPFHTLMVRHIPELQLTPNGQCFPFYSYDEDGSNRVENISDWALQKFQKAFGKKVTKWDIFHYVYALLHSPKYRTKYAANLKKELPRIPLPESKADFTKFVKAGEKLATLHVDYEQQKEYKLDFIENPKEKLDWRVTKMKLTKDKTAIVYNDFLTLAGIPPETFDYKLGTRSALDWIIERYRVTTDKRSGIVNDPNRDDDEQYIVQLIGKVVTVSLETNKIVKSLPALPTQ